MFVIADYPSADITGLLDQALAQLDAGLALSKAGRTEMSAGNAIVKALG